MTCLSRKTEAHIDKNEITVNNNYASRSARPFFSFKYYVANMNKKLSLLIIELGYTEKLIF